MKMTQNKKGAALIMVAVLAMLFAITEATLFSIMKYRISNCETWLESSRAYYLLETGASIAIVDIGSGRIGNAPGQWTERDVSIPLGGSEYSVNYKVTKEGGRWFVTTSVDSPLSLGRIYYLRLGGVRAFPYFIRGKG